MVNQSLKISLGNKTVDVVSLVAVASGAILFLGFQRWGWLVSLFILLIYLIQSSNTYNITLIHDVFLIENIFRASIRIDISHFDSVYEVIPFTHLMKIKFKDGSDYLFWGKSETELNRVIRESI